MRGRESRVLLRPRAEPEQRDVRVVGQRVADAVRDGQPLTLVRTRYRLVPLPSGATELRREVVWRRHLAPALYFAWLQQVVIQRGQDRLLELIRRRVGEPARDQAPIVARLDP